MTEINLGNVGPWCPIPLELLRKYGARAAAIFGVVWYFAKKNNGNCTASQAEITKNKFASQ